jgi:HAD superfamily hydrolase (TIGR01509 family)
MTAPRCVVFDLDGTLVDSFLAHYMSFRDAYAELGVEFTESDFRTLFGKLARNIARDFASARPGLEGLDYARFADRKNELFRVRHVRGVKAFPGVAGMLSGIGSYGLAVASNSSRRNVDAMLATAGLGGFFDAVVGFEDVSKPKPDPEMLVKACEKAGSAPAVSVAVDDSIHGIQAAKRAGMRSVAVLTGGATRDELSQLRPDLVLDGAWQLDEGVLDSLF